jgi:import inner membrane translocase subunit TIM17
MGAVGGGIWHALKGAKNSPAGARLRGGLEVSSGDRPAPPAWLDQGACVCGRRACRGGARLGGRRPWPRVACVGAAANASAALAPLLAARLHLRV